MSCVLNFNIMSRQFSPPYSSHASCSISAHSFVMPIYRSARLMLFFCPLPASIISLYLFLYYDFLFSFCFIYRYIVNLSVSFFENIANHAWFACPSHFYIRYYRYFYFLCLHRSVFFSFISLSSSALLYLISGFSLLLLSSFDFLSSPHLRRFKTSSTAWPLS